MKSTFKMVRVCTHKDPVTGYGVFTPDALEQGACAVSVPAGLILHPERCRAQLERVWGPCPLLARDCIVLYLALHRRMEKEASPAFTDMLQHGPYVAILPDSFMTPLHFTESERMLLDNTSLANGTKQRLHSTSEAAERVSTWLRKVGHEAKWAADAAMQRILSTCADISAWLTLWRWADDAYGSRSFPSRIAGWAAEQDQTVPILIPGLDSINHRRAEPVTWEYVDGATCLYLRGRTEAGAQLFNNYGAKSNEELLGSYAFVEPDGPDDVLVMALRADDSSAAPTLYYWHKSEPNPPPKMLEALQAQVPAPCEADVTIAGLLHEASTVEALEQYTRVKQRGFERTDKLVHDTVPWTLPDESDGVRPPVLTMVRTYRKGTPFHLPRPGRLVGKRRRMDPASTGRTFGRIGRGRLRSIARRILWSRQYIRLPALFAPNMLHIRMEFQHVTPLHYAAE